MAEYLSDAFQGDAEAAIVEYSAEFATALEAAPRPITEPFTTIRESNGTNLITRWYIPLHAAGYEEWNGTLNFRRLSEKFFDLKISKWTDGVAADADTVAARDFGGFSTSPQTMALNASIFPDEKLADQLNDGENIDCWDGQKFLAATAVKPFNVFEPNKFGKYKNHYTGVTLDEAQITAMPTNMMGRKGANGKSLGLMGTHLWLSTALYETGRRLVEVPTLAAGGANPLFGRLKAVHYPQLHAKRFAVVDNSKPDLKPFAMSRMNGGKPEMIEHGKDSALYQKSLEVGFNAIIRMGHRLAMPQAIEVGVVP